jgi:hypothetical protein
MTIADEYYVHDSKPCLYHCQLQELRSYHLPHHHNQEKTLSSNCRRKGKGQFK